MPKENIFDLDKLVKSISSNLEEKIPSIDYETEKEETPGGNSYEEFLVGYKLVPEEEWSKIQVGSLIRYLNKDNTFRKGGAVQGVFKKKGNNVIRIDIESIYGTRAKWSILSNKVDKIWIKPSILENLSVPNNNVDLEEVKDDIEFCKQSIKLLTTEIQKMKNEQMRILSVIKKLHNIQ